MPVDGLPPVLPSKGSRFPIITPGGYGRLPYESAGEVSHAHRSDKHSTSPDTRRESEIVARSAVRYTVVDMGTGPEWLSIWGDWVDNIPDIANVER
jgi:hypothetical protein